MMIVSSCGLRADESGFLNIDVEDQYWLHVLRDLDELWQDAHWFVADW